MGAQPRSMLRARLQHWGNKWTGTVPVMLSAAAASGESSARRCLRQSARFCCCARAGCWSVTATRVVSGKA